MQVPGPSVVSQRVSPIDLPARHCADWQNRSCFALIDLARASGSTADPQTTARSLSAEKGEPRL
jgi:hypothetical protein